MKILGIETSCDETAASIVEDGTKIISNVVSSSLALHAKAGGVIPELAAREQVKAIIPVLKEACRFSPTPSQEIDAIAVTTGPGLIGPLLVGVEAAKTLAYVWGKPAVPVNHLIAHLYSAWLAKPWAKLPAVALIVSGGHTELLLVYSHGKWRHLGGTRDDAAGEALDKIARFIGLGYPGGPALEKVAASGERSRFSLPHPLLDSPTFDFSFSGLKTSVFHLVRRLGTASKLNRALLADLAASIQECVAEILVKKTVSAAKKFQTKSIILAGGVAANKRLRELFRERFTGDIYLPSPDLATDNAAMVGAAAYFNFHPQSLPEVRAEPSVLF